jgi:hypothetical protein
MALMQSRRQQLAKLRQLAKVQVLLQQQKQKLPCTL